MADPLKREKAYLRANLEDLSKAHPGKYLLIKGETLVGAFETYERGVSEGVRKLGAGPFLVRSVLHADDAAAPSIPALAVGVPLVAHP